MNNRIVFERARQLETSHPFKEHIEEDMKTQTEKTFEDDIREYKKIIIFISIDIFRIFYAVFFFIHTSRL